MIKSSFKAAVLLAARFAWCVALFARCDRTTARTDLRRKKKKKGNNKTNSQTRMHYEGMSNAKTSYASPARKKQQQIDDTRGRNTASRYMTQHDMTPGEITRHNMTVLQGRSITPDYTYCIWQYMPWCRNGRQGVMHDAWHQRNDLRWPVPRHDTTAVSRHDRTWHDAAKHDTRRGDTIWNDTTRQNASTLRSTSKRWVLAIETSEDAVPSWRVLSYALARSVADAIRTQCRLLLAQHLHRTSENVN